MSTYVLDTNILMGRPIEEVIMNFEEGSEIVIPLCVLAELDKHKNGHDERNFNSRCANRFLSNLMILGSLRTGIKFRDRTIRVYILQEELDMAKIDNQIIVRSLETSDDIGEPAFLTTQDINLKVIADALGMNVYSPGLCDDIELENLYDTTGIMDITDEQAKQYEKSGRLMATKEFGINQFVEMVLPDGKKLYGIYCYSDTFIYPMLKSYKALGIKPKVNVDRSVVMEQAMYMHYLMEPSIKLVSCLGEAGTGKTLLALAVGLENVIKGKYDKIVITRPLSPLGEEIGFLPGDKMEKLESWMASTYDNLEYLVDNHSKELNAMLPYPISGNTIKERVNNLVTNLIDDGKLEFEAFTYLRGRTLRKQYVICDDSQNSTPHEMATLVTRIGNDSKLVILGDINEQQIDNNRLSPRTNGMVHVINGFSNVSGIVAHIALKQVVRSELAELAVRYLSVKK